MRVQNLTDSTVMLGDGRVIGAKGTPDAVRKYHRTELTAKDKDRVERGKLKVLADVETKKVVDTAKPTTAKDTTTKEKK